MSKRINDILDADELSHISQFTQKDQDWINNRIYDRIDGQPGVDCIIRGKNDEGDYFKLTPEEIIRQLYVHKLIEEFGYTCAQIKFELPVVFAGKEVIKNKRVDIAVFNKDETGKIDILIEVKRPKVKSVYVADGTDVTTPYQQMQSYCRALQPKIGAIANGSNLLKFYDASEFENELTIDKFPRNGENITEWKEKRRFTLKQLMQADRLQTETLKDIILEVEQRFGANDSSDKAFEEIFKLIFIKLYDEILSGSDADEIAILMNKAGKELKDIDDSEFRTMEFRVNESESPDDIYNRLNTLFQNAKGKWPGVFPADSMLEMQKATVKSCVRELQNVKLFNSNLEDKIEKLNI